MLNLYQEILMDHYRNPRNHGILDVCNMRAEQRNSSCGDEVICTGTIHKNVLVSIAFKGKGCVISQATASIISEFVMHKPLDAILVLDKDDLINMIGMRLGPVRLLCGLLSLTALQLAISDYKQRNE
ncbi:MAG TPA: iron-sulfur cluster assembly scaffold protein [Candidatus Babeliales bacterium]|nr:iron-sulfur cluster assembly scaffold protein [Candidatus Babeliales bacterium]